MARKIVWLTCSLLVVLALLVASCAPKEEVAPAAPAAPAVKEVAPAVKEAAPVVAGKLVAPVAEAPEYGGVLKLVMRNRVLSFDQGNVLNPVTAIYSRLVGESGYRQDWAKGPSGTGEIDFEQTQIIVEFNAKEALAVGWEMPDATTIILHLRQGIHYHNKPPANGREFVAADVIAAVWRVFWEPAGWGYFGFANERKPQKMTALDKYTVEIKIFPGMQGEVLRTVADWIWWNPREIVEKYGTGWTDWKLLIGTGPFIITDHVEEVQTSFVRNPDYWETDPYGPGKGNQLPYVDGVTLTCIPDATTRLAALRTGKIDQSEWFTRENVQDLLATTPQLKTAKWLESGLANSLSMRSDTPPTNDVRVRRALSMAIDREAIAQSIYGGEANFFIIPVAPTSVHLGKSYVPLSELPPSAREVYEYHPDKARQLLVEAGYPTGFKVKALAYDTTQIDMLSVVKGYFAKIGVELTIDVKEFGVYSRLTTTSTIEDMVCAGQIGRNPFRFHPYRSRAQKGLGFAFINDPKIEAASLLCDTPAGQADWDVKSAQIAALAPYIVEQAWYIELPSGFQYNAWWPWLKNYSGELGAYAHYFPYSWAQYVWIDQALKKSMGK